MTFSSPQWLLLLLAVPALGAVYAVRLRHRARRTPLAEPHLVAGLLPRAPGVRRHLPAAALGVVASAGVLAAAGPTATVADRRDAATLMVAIDVSGSMRQTDVAPNRLEAAKQAANDFIADLPDHIEVGVVEFAGTATVLVPPSSSTDDARVAIQGLTPKPATAIGEAVHVSLDVLTGRTGQVETAADEDAGARRIVLLSDGSNTSGRPVEGATRAAAAQSVPVDTIAFGTDLPQTQGTQAGVDRAALRALASGTGGTAYEAASSDELAEAYERIGSESLSEDVRRPVSDWMLGGALLAGLAGAVASLTWFRRLPV